MNLHFPGDADLTMIVSKLAFAALAALGGVAKHLNEYLRGSTFRIQQLIANTVVSGFSGYIFAEAALQFNPSWTYVAAGIGGYMGSQALDFIMYAVRRSVEKRLKLDTCSLEHVEPKK